MTSLLGSTGELADSDSDDSIFWTVGTFRTRAPDETWELIQPLLRKIGCARVTDLTHLDPTGIPVHAAIRPLARSLTTAHGKGVSASLSRVSAAMESIESWYAERSRAPAVTGAPRSDLVDRVHYPVAALDLARPSLLHDGFPLDWTPATTLISGRQTLVPLAYVSLDRTVGDGVWRPPLFDLSNNGLASGNTVEEAVFHALCEIIEREAISEMGRYLSSRPVDLDALEDRTVRELVARIRERSRGFVRLYGLPNSLNVPCLACVTEDDRLPITFGGFGCHPDLRIAATRAITEAIQSRVAVIAGYRDDLPHNIYRTAKAGRDRAALPLDVAFADPPASVPVRSLSDGVMELAKRIVDHTGYEPVVVILSEPGDPVAAVRVVGPGMRGHNMQGLRMPGRQR